LPSARLLTTWEQYTPHAASMAVFSMCITLQLLFTAIHAMYLHQLHTCSRQIETRGSLSISLHCINARNLQERSRCVAASPRHVRMSSRRLACCLGVPVKKPKTRVVCPFSSKISCFRQIFENF
jgi:hypothetical protein